MKEFSNIIIFTIFLWSCKISPAENNSNTISEPDMQKISWILGTWINSTEDEKLYETWEKKDDSTLLGKSYVVRAQDTLLLETIQLQKRAGKIFYTPYIGRQEEKKPVSFELILNNSGEHVFENLSHDFPQRIIYMLRPDGSMYSRIEGVFDGEEQYADFVMTKQR